MADEERYSFEEKQAVARRIHQHTCSDPEACCWMNEYTDRPHYGCYITRNTPADGGWFETGLETLVLDLLAGAFAAGHSHGVCEADFDDWLVTEGALDG